jgi:hypothetical protein
MPLSFPSNPIAGQTTTQNGRTYSWSGYAWEFITQNVNSARSSLTTTSNTSNISVTGGYVPGYLDLFQNGSKLLSGSDYTATDGTSITLANSVPSGTTIEYITLLPSVNNNLYTKLDNISSSFNGSSTSFGLSVSGTPYYPVSSNTLGIYVGGVAQEPISSYSVSGSNIVFTEAPASGLTFWGVGYGTTAVATLNGIAPGSSGYPAISSSSDLSTGFYFPSSGNISVAGNLGIGTSSPSTLLDVNSNKFRVRNSKTPSSSSDTGNQGDICWDSNYIYICASTNSWVRASLSTWTPVTSIPGLQAWFDASDASTLFDATSGGSLVAADGVVARWEDKSGNGRHATQATSGSRPIRKSNQTNGLDAILFDGTNDFLSLGSITIPASHSVFQVYQRLGGVQSFGIAGIPTRYASLWFSDGVLYQISNADFTTHGTSSDSTGYFLVSTIRNATTSIELRRNGSTVSLVTTGAGVTNAASGTWTLIGDRTAGNFHTGNLCEIIVYDTALSDANRSAVESYLMTKWGIS